VLLNTSCARSVTIYCTWKRDCYWILKYGKNCRFVDIKKSIFLCLSYKIKVFCFHLLLVNELNIVYITPQISVWKRKRRLQVFKIAAKFVFTRFLLLGFIGHSRRDCRQKGRAGPTFHPLARPSERTKYTDMYRASSFSFSICLFFLLCRVLQKIFPFQFNRLACLVLETALTFPTEAA
jgi:hypothetical protein